jgi:hypothetical protein
MARKNKDGKWTTFWVAKTNDDGTIGMRQIDLHDRKTLQNDPELQGEGVGKLRIENDDQVMSCSPLTRTPTRDSNRRS